MKSAKGWGRELSVDHQAVSREEFGAPTAAVRKRVFQKLAQIESTPRMVGAIKLSGSSGTYRVRAGDYRVVYEIDDSRETVFVTVVAHRREVYRDH